MRLRKNGDRRHFRAAALLVCAAVAAATPACRRSGRQLLHESDSQFNHIVVREETPGIRTLQFANGGVIQSRVNVDDPMDLHLEYTRATMLAWALKPKPQRVLIIGLGGGAMPRFFHHALPDARIDVAELDPEVHLVAKRYFGLPQDDRLVVHVGDGRKFVQDSKQQWDLVILDAYGDSEIPRHLATTEFLLEVKAHLAPGAVVAGNVWSPEHNALHDAMAKAWMLAFGPVCVVTIGASANRIFLSSNGEDVSAPAIRAAAQKLTVWPAVASYAPAECLTGWETADALHDP